MGIVMYAFFDRVCFFGANFDTSATKDTTIWEEHDLRFGMNAFRVLAPEAV
jgi:nucleoside-specific outer membrane channel protein Tsx